MHLPLVITLVIALPLDQVFQAVVIHLAIEYHLDLILLLIINESCGWGGTDHRPGMGSESMGDSLTTGKTA
jgi:hypothetical protein